MGWKNALDHTTTVYHSLQTTWKASGPRLNTGSQWMVKDNEGPFIKLHRLFTPCCRVRAMACRKLYTSIITPYYTPFQKNTLHPGRLTWNIIMEVWKVIFLSKWKICRFHVNLRGCSHVKPENTNFPTRDFHPNSSAFTPLEFLGPSICGTINAWPYIGRITSQPGLPSIGQFSYVVQGRP